MIRGTFVALFVYLATFAPSNAQVTVRSGEHAGFTRLVFYFEELEGWRLGRTADGYGLRVDGDAVEFDLKDVFAFIPRSRILDIEQVSNGLNFASNCECYANAYEYRPGILVFDIKSGAASTDARFESQLEAVDQQRDDEKFTVLPLFFPTSPSLHALTAPKASSSSVRELTPEGPLADIVAPLNNLASRDTLLERQLVQQFGRALSQGLLAQDDSLPARTSLPKPVSEDKGDLTTNPQSSLVAEKESDLDQTSQPFEHLPNVRVHSAMDAISSGTTDDLSNSCNKGNYFDFSNGEQFQLSMQALLEARESFLDDLARPTPDAVTQLAKAYLGMGFGAEAAQVLDLYSSDRQIDQVFRSLAELIDQPEKGLKGALRNQVNCDSHAALWALLAFGSDKPEGGINDKAILRTISALPLHLRRHLVPTVSERLRRLGHDSTAAAVRQTVLRAQQQPQASMELEMVLADSTPVSHAQLESRDEDLLSASSPTSSVSEKAVTALLDNIEQAEGLMTDALLLQVASEIHTTRGSNDGQQLLEAYMKALGRRGSSQPAIEMLSRLDGSRFAESYDLSSASLQFLRSLESNTQSGAFVVGAVAFQEGFDLDRVPADARYQVAARLDALNLSDQARQYRATDRADPVPGSALEGSQQATVFDPADINHEDGYLTPNRPGAKQSGANIPDEKETGAVGLDLWRLGSSRAEFA